MLDCGAISPSESPFSSNVVLVTKKDGSLRFCIDHRLLNSRTRKDAYMLPRFDDAVDVLHGARYFSKLDLRSAYWQVEIEESDREKTAFSVGNLGFYQCNRMSYGLCNAPASFQRLMERCMGDMHLRDCLVFIDDILIFSRNFDEHLERLEAVFRRLVQHGLKLKPSKCELFKTSVEYLGHVISADGISTDPEKVRAISTWPVPSNVKELRSYLGFAGYYRRFVDGYSRIAAPLNKLLEGNSTTAKSKRNKKPLTQWTWGPDQQKAFDTIKEKLTQPPILGIADYSRPFVVHTDASSFGLGATLVQVQEGRERVIAYASRGLRRNERNYPAHKLEFLALKWAVTDKFHDYLYGNTFSVLTDSNPMTYVLSTAKLDATQHRWVASLANYNFSLSYKTGKTNTDADGLSRLPEMFSESVKAICLAVSASVPLVETLACGAQSHSADETVVPPAGVKQVAWAAEQHSDQTITRVADLVRGGVRPREEECRSETTQVQKLLREWNRLFLEEGVLYRSASHDGQTVNQLVLPTSQQTIAFNGIHSEVGHPGKAKSLWLARQRFYWPGMEADIERRIGSCRRCVCRKTPIKPMAELLPIVTTRPMQLVCIDFLKVDKSKGGYEEVLVITDHFTRYAKAVPCRKTTAHATAKALYEQFIVNFSFPEQIHSDQGKNFDCKLIKELCQLAGVKKTRTTPYHPSGNGGAERFNRTLLKMLGTLDESRKSDWPTYIGPLVQAYNATRHDSTGYSPHFLMFGWHPRLSIDAYLGSNLNEESAVNPSTYVSKLRDRMHFAYGVASKNASKRAQLNKRAYDAKVPENRLEEGDMVLVRKVGLRGRNKLADKWEHDPYVILEIPDRDVPVFKVQLETRKGPVRTLHRNMLLPFVSIPNHEDEPPQDIPQPKVPKRRLRSSKPRVRNASDSDTESDTGSDTSDSSRYIIPQLRNNTNAPQYHPPVRRLDVSTIDWRNNTVDASSVRLLPDQSSSPRVDSSDPARLHDETPIDVAVSTRHSDIILNDHTASTGPTNQLEQDESRHDRSTGAPAMVTDTAQQDASPHQATDVSQHSEVDQSLAEPPTVRQDASPHQSTDVSRVDQSLAEPSPVPVPVTRPTRQRRPPDRYGEWVMSQSAFYI